MAGVELNALSGALGQRADVREAGRIAECHRGRRRNRAAAERAWLEGRWISLLRADGPFAIAIIAEREGDPWLVYRVSQRLISDFVSIAHRQPSRDKMRLCTLGHCTQPSMSDSYHTPNHGLRSKHGQLDSYLQLRSKSDDQRHHCRMG